MTTTVFAHTGTTPLLTPLLALPSFRRENTDRDEAHDSTRDSGHDSGRGSGREADGVPGAELHVAADGSKWTALIDVDSLVPTEIWLRGPLGFTTNHVTLLDNACEGFRTGESGTYRAASRSVSTAYGSELLRSWSGSQCSVVYVSRTIDQDFADFARPDDLDVAHASDVERGAVATVLDLADRLGVNETIIYRAAGIKGRTFKHWKKKPDTVPRPDSLGTLWSLASAVDDLDEHLAGESPARWLRARTERLDALKEGQFRQFVDESLGLLAVSPESTAHREGVMLNEEAQGTGVLASDDEPVEVRSWELDDETPTEVVLE